MVERRRTFGPVVVVGLGAAALAAVAGGQDWAVPDPSVGGTAPVPSAMGGTTAAADAPLAGALALVVLACWGVVLVTRGRFRRVVSLLGAVAGAGFAAVTVSAPWTVRPEAGTVEAGVVQAPYVLTGWWWTALLAAVLVVLSTVLAAVLARHWPEMGSRYDAPAGADATGPAGPQTNLDLWKALDEGRDPTA